MDPDDGPLSPDEGGGPPIGTPWTLVVDGDEAWSADLEHAAVLPRIGERVEFIGDDGGRRHFRVTDVVHTVQTSATIRPPVHDEQASPNAILEESSGGGPPRLLRAGLPRVVVGAEDGG